MLSPGSITNSVPDPDKAVRLQRDTQRIAQENISSVSASFQTTVAALIKPVAATTTSLNFNIPGDSAVVVVSLPVIVPGGFTSALITASMTVTGKNTTSQTSSLYAYIQINSLDGGIYGLSAKAINGELTQASSTHSRTISGLIPGQTINLQGFSLAATSGLPPTTSWAASVSNQASLMAQVIFTR